MIEKLGINFQSCTILIKIVINQSPHVRLLFISSFFKLPRRATLREKWENRKLNRRHRTLVWKTNAFFMALGNIGKKGRTHSQGRKHFNNKAHHPARSNSLIFLEIVILFSNLILNKIIRFFFFFWPKYTPSSQYNLKKSANISTKNFTRAKTHSRKI